MATLDIFFSAILLFLMWNTAFFLRLLEGHWLAPGCLMAFLWASLVSATLLFRPQYPVTNLTLSVVLFFVLLFGSGSILGQGQINLHGRLLRIKRVVIEPEFPFLSVACLTTFVLGLVPSILTILKYSETTSNLGVVGAWLHIANQETLHRYSGVGTPWYENLCLIFVYLSPLFGGLLFIKKGWLTRVTSLLTLVPGLFYAAITVAKAGLIFATIFWFSAYFSASFYKYGLKFKFLTARACLVLVTLLVALILFFIYLQGFRYGYKDLSNLEEMLQRMDSYFFASLPPLSSWIDNNNLLESRLGLGRWSLAGVYDFVGLEKREPGLYRDVITIGAYQSNVYSIFRGLIQDFSFLGAAFVIMLAGVIAGKYFKILSAGNMSGLILLPAIYSQIFWSPIVSIFNYNSVLMAFGGFAVYIFVCIQKENDSVRGLHRSSTNLIKS